jgi:hypothetical protein
LRFFDTAGVSRDLCPQECPDWLYYEYFPQAHAVDLEDFWPQETIVATMEATGFAAVTVEREHLRFEQDLRVWLDAVRRRDTNSQLMAISEQPTRVASADWSAKWQTKVPRRFARIISVCSPFAVTEGEMADPVEVHATIQRK